MNQQWATDWTNEWRDGLIVDTRQEYTWATIELAVNSPSVNECFPRTFGIIAPRQPAAQQLSLISHGGGDSAIESRIPQPPDFVPAADPTRKVTSVSWLTGHSGVLAAGHKRNSVDGENVQ